MEMCLNIGNIPRKNDSMTADHMFQVFKFLNLFQVSSFLKFTLELMTSKSRALKELKVNPTKLKM